MAPLLFICPKKAHEISVRETYIDGALNDAYDQLRHAI
jgi:hypothetical protein